MAQQRNVCSKADCTFAITGTCLESIGDPTHQCPHLNATASESPAEDQSAQDEDPEGTNEAVRKFANGLELGLQDAARLMRSKYHRLIGILGQANAGKTSLLLSLYFQLADRRLCPRFRFAASDTLLGFEQRARLLRDWSQGIPDQIVDHTHLGHSRSPAFLHLALQDDQATRHDLLLPDLPGEWTTSLLSDASKADRFAFLSRSEVVLIALEALTFANARSRNNAVADAIHLIARLEENIHLPKTIPFILAVTKCDQTNGDVPTAIESVARAVLDRGYSVSTIPLAAFPDQESQIPTGFGIDTLLEHLIAPCADAKNDRTEISGPTSRSYLKVRGPR